MAHPFVFSLPSLLLLLSCFLFPRHKASAGASRTFTLFAMRSLFFLPLFAAAAVAQASALPFIVLHGKVPRVLDSIVLDRIDDSCCSQLYRRDRGPVFQPWRRQVHQASRGVVRRRWLLPVILYHCSLYYPHAYNIAPFPSHEEINIMQCPTHKFSLYYHP